MNKDIQTLIEREAEKRALESVKLHHSDINSINAKFEFKSIYEDIMFGANIVSSLFKWRKVEDELPKMETVLIRVMCHYPNGNHEIIVTTGTILSVDKCNLDNEFIEEIARSYKATEWMPIPQID